MVLSFYNQWKFSSSINSCLFQRSAQHHQCTSYSTDWEEKLAATCFASTLVTHQQMVLSKGRPKLVVQQANSIVFLFSQIQLFIFYFWINNVEERRRKRSRQKDRVSHMMRSIRQSFWTCSDKEGGLLGNCNHMHTHSE